MQVKMYGYHGFPQEEPKKISDKTNAQSLEPKADVCVRNLLSLLYNLRRSILKHNYSTKIARLGGRTKHECHVSATSPANRPLGSIELQMRVAQITGPACELLDLHCPIYRYIGEALILRLTRTQREPLQSCSGRPANSNCQNCR